MDSDSAISKAGSFVGNLTGATIATCFSNIKASKLSLGGIDDTIYSDVVSVMPPVPTSVELEVVRNEMTTDDESFQITRFSILIFMKHKRKMNKVFLIISTNLNLVH